MHLMIAFFRSLLTDWRFGRRLTQLLVLGVFACGFLMLSMSPEESANRYLKWFFRVDPFLAASAMLAARAMLWTFWPAMVLMILTAIFGRFFCGWICPLGTLLDILGRFVRIGQRFDPQTIPTRRWPHRLKYALLILGLASALGGWPIAAHLDPFPMLGQAIIQGFIPGIDAAVSHTSLWLQRAAPTTVGQAGGDLYRWMLEHRLIDSPLWRAGGGMAIGLLIAILLLERLGKRFWCRYLCPLGSLLNLTASRSWLSRCPASSCLACGLCAANCRMGAFDNPKQRLQSGDCTLCMDCVKTCPKSIAKFRLVPPRLTHRTPLSSPASLPVLALPSINLSRRTLLTAGAAGLAIPLLHQSAKTLGVTIAPDAVIRPPGAVDQGQDGFADQCLRCGLCLKACPTHVLQPAIFQAGIEGWFTPLLDFEKGYCRYECHQCAQVCPSQAIRPMDLATKQATPIAQAMVDPSACLPWAANEPCLRCEDHCPVPDKAIKVLYVTVTQPDGSEEEIGRPQVDHRLCIGCGICQNQCPVERPAIGIRVIPLKKPVA